MQCVYPFLAITVNNVPPMLSIHLCQANEIALYIHANVLFTCISLVCANVGKFWHIMCSAYCNPLMTYLFCWVLNLCIHNMPAMRILVVFSPWGVIIIMPVNFFSADSTKTSYCCSCRCSCGCPEVNIWVS